MSDEIKITRQERIGKVQELSKRIKEGGGDEIVIGQFKRHKIVQEEIVDAYISPVPSAVKTPAGSRQVDKGNWVLIHSDGSESTMTPDQFAKVFTNLKAEDIAGVDTATSGGEDPEDNV